MPALEALTFDIDLNTAAFEQGAQNVEAILRNLLGGAFHNLGASIEIISQNLLGVSNAGAEMGNALITGGDAAAQALQRVEDKTKDVSLQTHTSAEQTATLWEKAAKRIEFSMRTALRSFIGPMAAVFGVHQMFSQYTNTADRLGKMAKSMDLNIGDIQAWSEAAIRAGGSAEGFQGSLQSLNRQVQMMDAKGGKGGQKGGGSIPGAARLQMVLDTLGVKAKDTHGKVKDVFTLLPELASAADKMGHSKFAAFAGRLGLDRGTIQLLQLGRTEVDKLVERQRKLGGYTLEDAKVAEEFKDAMADLTQVFKMFAAIIMRTVTPVLTAVAKALTWLTQVVKENETLVRVALTLLGGQLFGKIFPTRRAGIMTFGGEIVKFGAKVLSTAGRIVTGVATSAMKIRFSFASIGVAFKSLWASIKGVFTGFVLPLLIEDLIYFALGKKSLTGYAWYKLKDKIKEFGEWALEFFNGILDKLKKAWDSFVEMITGWMPEDLKKRLGLVKSTPAEKFEQEVEDETKRRQAEDTTGQKTWETHNREAREFVKSKYEAEGKEVPVVSNANPSQGDSQEQQKAQPEVQVKVEQRANELVRDQGIDFATALEMGEKEQSQTQPVEVNILPSSEKSPAQNETLATPDIKVEVNNPSQEALEQANISEQEDTFALQTEQHNPEPPTNEPVVLHEAKQTEEKEIKIDVPQPALQKEAPAKEGALPKINDDEVLQEARRLLEESTNDEPDTDWESLKAQARANLTAKQEAQQPERQDRVVPAKAAESQEAPIPQKQQKAFDQEAFAARLREMFLIGKEKSPAPSNGADSGASALGILSQIGESLKIALSHDASTAVPPVVNQSSNVKIDSDLHVTQNITTNDPQQLADKAVTPLKRFTTDAFRGVVTPWNNGNSVVTTAPAM